MPQRLVLHSFSYRVPRFWNHIFLSRSRSAAREDDWGTQPGGTVAPDLVLFVIVRHTTEWILSPEVTMSRLTTFSLLSGLAVGA